MDNKQINKDLINFWNTSLTLPDEYKNQEIDEISDYKELAPSAKQLDAIAKLGKCTKVLDYGCGTAWASIIAERSGCKDVLAVDLGEAIIESANFYKKAYGAINLNIKQISPDWLNNQIDNIYDGIVCSNVLDVLPLETSIDILKNLSRIAKKDALVIISLNFYLTKELQEKRQMNLIDDKYLFVDGILRLTNLSDEEWQELFNPYFEIVNIDHYSWPGEQKETRRLFTLKKK